MISVIWNLISGLVCKSDGGNTAAVRFEVSDIVLEQHANCTVVTHLNDCWSYRITWRSNTEDHVSVYSRWLRKFAQSH